MANPCGFTYTDKEGKVHNFKDEAELLEALKNGLVDASGLKEMLDTKSIQDQNTAVLDAVQKIKDDNKLTKEDLKERVGFITSMLNEAYRSGTYTSKQVRELSRAALNIAKAANKNLAIAKFVDMLDKNVSIKDWDKKQKELNNKKETLSKQISSAKVTKDEYYLQKLASFLAIDINDIPADMMEMYERTLGMGLSKNTTIQLMVDNAIAVTDATYRQLENINYLEGKIQDFYETDAYSNIIEKSIDNVAEQMFGDGIISQADRDFIIDNQEKFFNGDGIPDVKPQKIEDTSETIIEIKNQKSALEGMRANFADLFDRPTRERLDFVLNGITDEYLQSLGQAKANSLLQILSIMKGGYQSRTLEGFKVSIDSFNRSKNLSDLFINNFKKNFFFQPVARAKAVIKSLAGKKTDYSKEVIRRTFGFGLDSLYFKDIGGNPVYEAIFGKSANIFGSAKELQDRLENEYVAKGLSILRKANNNTPNEIIKSNIKIGLWLVQEMNNAGMENSPPVKEYFKNIFEDPTKFTDIYSEKEINYIKSQIDNVGNPDFLTPQEMEAVGVLRGMLGELTDRSTEYSFFDLGTPLVRNEAYFPIRFSKVGGDTFESIKESFIGPSTTASGLKAKRGATKGDLALNLKDVFGIVENHAKEISLMGLRSESKTVNKTFDKLRQDILSDANLSQAEKNDRLLKVNYFKEIYDSSLDTAIGVSFVEKSAADSAFDFVGNVATTTKLVGTGKALADLTANTINALENPLELTSGAKIFSDIVLSEGLNHNKIIQNIGTAQGYRLVKRKTSLLGGAEMLTTGKRAKRRTDVSSEFVDKFRKFEVLTTDNVSAGLEWINRNMINNPDMAVAIPLFYGSFEAKFSEITGEKPDYKKIQENDIEYIDKYRDAIYKASTYADINISKSVGTKNPFSIAESIKQKPDANIAQRTWQLTNQFFNSFNFAAGNAIDDAARRGAIDGSKTAAIKLGSNMAYSAINKAVNAFIITGTGALIGGSMSDVSKTEEDEIYSERRAVIDGIIQTATQGSGQLTKSVVGAGVEEINKAVGKDITYSGKYEGRFKAPSKKTIGYEKPISEVLDADVSEMTKLPVVDIAGKSITKVKEAILPEEKSKQETIKINKRNQMTFLGRSIDALASLGILPLGKDIMTGIGGFKRNLIYNKQYLSEQGKDMSIDEKRDFDLKSEEALDNTVFDLFWLDLYGDKYYSKDEVKQRYDEANKKIGMIFNTKNDVMEEAINNKYNENIRVDVLNSNMPEAAKRYWAKEILRAQDSDVRLNREDLMDIRRDIEKYEKNPPKVVDISKEVDSLIKKYNKGDIDVNELKRRFNNDIIYSTDKESASRLLQVIEDDRIK